MKHIFFLLFVLLFVNCEKKDNEDFIVSSCWECHMYHEILAQWRFTSDPAEDVSGFPRIKDTTFIFCNITEQDILNIEKIGTKDTFWIKFGDLYVQTHMKTTCVKW